MIGLRDASLRRKLTAIVMITTGASLTFAAVSYILYDRFMVRTALGEERTMLADIVGANTTAAITFDDRASADETLSALQRQPHVILACLYHADASLFARYARAWGSTRGAAA